MTSSMKTDACVNRFFASLAYFHVELYLFENRYFKTPRYLLLSDSLYCYDGARTSKLHPFSVPEIILPEAFPAMS